MENKLIFAYYDRFANADTHIQLINALPEEISVLLHVDMGKSKQAIRLQENFIGHFVNGCNRQIEVIRPESNLGVRAGIKNAMTKASVESANLVLVEDDCHSSVSNILLLFSTISSINPDKYFGVSGNTFVKSSEWYQSRYLHCWGWGTRSESWNKYISTDINRVRSEALRNGAAMSSRPFLFSQYWRRMFEKNDEGLINSWNLDILQYLWGSNLKVLNPPVSLFKNNGFNGAHGSGSARLVRLSNSLYQSDCEAPNAIRRYEDFGKTIDDVKDVRNFGIGFYGFMRSFGYRFI